MSDEYKLNNQFLKDFQQTRMNMKDWTKPYTTMPVDSTKVHIETPIPYDVNDGWGPDDGPSIMDMIMGSNKGPVKEPEMGPQNSIRDFDMNDKESVKALQRRLGVTEDGMFGPETEKAYRLAVDNERKDQELESLKYDYNQQIADEKKFRPFGGLFRNAYKNMDKKLFKGKLPGGYKDENVMTAEEFYNK